MEIYSSGHVGRQLTLEYSNSYLMSSSLFSLLPPAELRAKYRLQVNWVRVGEEKEFLIEIWTCNFLVLNKILKTTHTARIFPALNSGHFH